MYFGEEFAKNNCNPVPVLLQHSLKSHSHILTPNYLLFKTIVKPSHEWTKKTKAFAVKE